MGEGRRREGRGGEGGREGGREGETYIKDHKIIT